MELKCDETELRWDGEWGEMTERDWDEMKGEMRLSWNEMRYGWYLGWDEIKDELKLRIRFDWDLDWDHNKDGMKMSYLKVV